MRKRRQPRGPRDSRSSNRYVGNAMMIAKVYEAADNAGRIAFEVTPTQQRDKRRAAQAKRERRAQRNRLTVTTEGN